MAVEKKIDGRKENTITLFCEVITSSDKGSCESSRNLQWGVEGGEAGEVCPNGRMGQICRLLLSDEARWDIQAKQQTRRGWSEIILHRFRFM